MPKIKIEIIIDDERMEKVVYKIQESANTGKIGDGKIFILPIEKAIRVRTGETGNIAI